MNQERKLTVKLRPELTWSNRVRVYELSEYLTKGKDRLFNQIVDLTDEKHFGMGKIKPEIAKQIDPSKGFNFIAVSDAFTHPERLVFPVIQYKDEKGETKTGRLSCNIEGIHTMMIHGGGKVYDDLVYIKLLAGLNGFTFNYKNIQ